jgi:hypothetical protein
MLFRFLFIGAIVCSTLNGNELSKAQETHPSFRLESQSAYGSKNLIINFFDFFNIHNQQLTVPSVNELEQFFSPNFRVVSNGELVCKNTDEYRNHFITLRNNFTKIDCSQLLEEPITSGNKTVIRYYADTTDKSGHQVRFQIIAILTFDGSKISNWTEVLHENRSIYWDK